MERDDYHCLKCFIRPVARFTVGEGTLYADYCMDCIILMVSE